MIEVDLVLKETSRTGVLRAAIDRAAVLKACGAEITEVPPSQIVLLIDFTSFPQAVFAAFETNTPEERKLLVPCVLRLQTPQVRRNNPLARLLLTFRSI